METFRLVLTVLVLAVMAIAAVLWIQDLLMKRRWNICLNQAKSIVTAHRLAYPGCEGAINGLTLEPAVKANAASANITLEDFLDQLDRIEPAATPLTTMCANEIELKATERSWDVDSYPSPKGALGRADGEAVTTASARNWAANMRKMGNIAQGHSETWGAGWIASRIPRIAGVTDIVAYGKASAAVMLKQHMEVAFGSFDQVAVIDQGSGLGAIGAGYLKLTDFANRYTAASAYVAGKPTDLHYAPTGACVTGALASVMARSLLKTVAFALRTAAKQKMDWMLVAGLSLRQAITDLTDPTTTTTTASAGALSQAATQVKIISRGEQDNVLGASIDVIQTDFGRILVTDSDYIGTTTTDVSGAALSAVNTTSGTGAGARGNAAFVSTPKKGVIVKKGNLFKMWGVAPFTEQLGKDGGGDTYDTKCVTMLGIRNPILAGWFNLT